MALLPTIQRDELIDELSNPHLKVIRLVAPAGYGKSTLAHALLLKRPHHAIADFLGVQSEVEACKVILDCVLAGLDEERRAQYIEQSVAFGTAVEGWTQLAAEVVKLLDGATLLIENAESLASNADIRSRVERIISGIPKSSSLIVCSRIDLTLRLGRFAGPERSRVVNADELRFNRGEIAQIFATVALKSGQLDEIERFTLGWPMVVMMLFPLARRGRLSVYLHENGDIADLYGYLAAEVLGVLEPVERELIEALSAIPNATEGDLRALFGGHTYEAALRRLERETPFVTRESGGQVSVHPAMRQILAVRGSADNWRKKLFDNVDRGDGGIRAAEIALLRGRPDDAARALMNLSRPFLLTTPSPRFNAVLSMIDRETLRGYPSLWNAAMLNRASYDVVATLHEGEQIAETLGDDTPVADVLGILNCLAQGYANRGRLSDAQRIANRLRTEERLRENATAVMLADFWDFLVAAYRGDPIDLTRIDREFAPLAESVATRAFIESIVIAAHYRLHGDRWNEKAALERSAEIAQSSNIPLVKAICFQHLAYGAWFWGEDLRFKRYIDAMEGSVNAAIANQFFLFLDAARGRRLTEATGSEALSDRAASYLMAAANSRSPTERIHLVEAAIIAAEHSGRRFARITARVARALVDPKTRDEDLECALLLARETESLAMIRSVRALEGRQQEIGMLSAFAARYDSELSIRSSELSIRIDLTTNIVCYGNRVIKISNKELELLVYLATRSAPIKAEEIVRALWPSADVERAQVSLRVTVTRTRRRFGEARVILSTPAGYALGLPIRVDHQDQVAARWAW